MLVMFYLNRLHTNYFMFGKTYNLEDLLNAEKLKEYNFIISLKASFWTQIDKSVHLYYAHQPKHSSSHIV
jgi:hypothetical protein